MTTFPFKQTFWMFAVFCILACSAWNYKHIQKSVGLDAETLANTEDLVVSTFSVKQFDAKGVLTHLMESPELTHISHQDTHFIKLPHIMVKEANKPVWNIHSQTAKAIQKGSKIIFSNQVVIQQAVNGTNLKTEELIYFPKKKFATSDAMVTVTQPGSIVRSKGINAYLGENPMVSLNKAHATYEPAHA
jgi:lipopolysaccharide export system protein LptC